MERILVSWSGGKDSAMALQQVIESRHYEVIALLTTVTEDYDRISMHGVRRSLLRLQAQSLGLKLEEVTITKEATNSQYEARMGEALARYRELGVDSVVFGDIFLEDLKRYREEKLAEVGMQAVFPIWKTETKDLARRFIANGFKAVTTCVDTQVLGKDYVGREIDEKFLAELPAGIDPCGENGEFHSFVYDGPILGRPVPIKRGEKVLRDGRFYYCDLLEA